MNLKYSKRCCSYCLQEICRLSICDDSVSILNSPGSPVILAIFIRCQGDPDMLLFGVLKYNSLLWVFWIRYFNTFFIWFDMMINITMRSLNNDQQQFCLFLLQHFTTLNTDRVRRLNGTSLLNYLQHNQQRKR